MLVRASIVRQLAARDASSKPLVLAEHAAGALNGATLHAVTAAAALGDVTVLVGGTAEECASVAAELSNVACVAKILTAKGEGMSRGLPEVFAPLLEAVVKAESFTHVLATATAFGKNVLPRAGALLDVAPIADITAVVDADTFERLIYAGNAVQTVRSADDVKLITVRPTAFERAALGAGAAPEVADAAPVEASASSEWLNEELSSSDRPELGSASVVVSGGRGLKAGENFALLEALADTMGGAVGASRAAVDAGFVPNDMQIGQTGKVVAPDLYVACGVSGAIQHLAGMKDSKVIVAINNDPEAPIFHVSDFGLVEDLFDAVPALTKKIAEHKK